MGSGNKYSGARSPVRTLLAHTAGTFYSEAGMSPIDADTLLDLYRALASVQTVGDMGIKPLEYVALHATCSSHGHRTVVQSEHEWSMTDGMVKCTHLDHYMAGVTRRMMPFGYSLAVGPW